MEDIRLTYIDGSAGSAELERPMLSSLNLDDRDYNDFFQEAVSQIPLYSNEWTNFNVSDPGITILQNFAAFHNLQQASINAISEDVRMKLLELVGFHRQYNVPACVIAAPMELSGEMVIPPDTKFTVEDVCLESIQREQIRNNRVISAFCEIKSNIADISSITDSMLVNVAYPFGKQPKTGNTFYFMMEARPREGEQLLFYLITDMDGRRNPFMENTRLSFATLTWQCYTSEGWVNLEARDETHAFVCSGEIELTMPDVNMVPYKIIEKEGYAFRCVLAREEYDLPPCVRQLTGNLIKFRQQDTKSKVLRLDGAETVSCCSQMLMYDFVKTYCREEGNGYYKEYNEYTGDSETLLIEIEKLRHARTTGNKEELEEVETFFENNVAKGRFYILRRLDDYAFEYTFSKEAFGYAPEGGAEAICIRCYSNDVLNHYKLGLVYGYENQRLEVGLFKRLVRDSFSVTIESKDGDGEKRYSFLRPGETGEDGLRYELDENEGKITITEAGIGDCCFLYMGDTVITSGEKGNIREGNVLKTFVPEDVGFGVPEVSFLNPSKGRGGIHGESVAHMRQRFKEDMAQPATAILAEDYEQIIKSVPGLCIKKVKAMSDKGENMIRVAVLPHSTDEYPVLSDLYKKEILRYVEKARVITTRIQLVQPQYIPIHVQGTIYVKSHFKNSQTIIEEMLRSELDYVNSDREFGEVLKYNELYHKIESLPCVDYIYDLKLRPQAGRDVKMKAFDICPADYCLCCPGQFVLEVNSHAMII